MRGRPPIQILSISCSFWEILAESYVGTPRELAPHLTGNIGSAHCFYLLQCLKFDCPQFSFNLGDCDHLDPYPVYSQTKNHNHNLTLRNKPWPPEIDFFDSYLNLSSFSQDVLDGLFLGYRVSNREEYLFRRRSGCWIEFKFDIELAQEHYLKYICEHK